MSTDSLASNLVGKTIGKWVVLSKRLRTDDDKSGSFGSCYVVKNIETEMEGFLKAFNYNYAFRVKGLAAGKTSADILKALTADFIYERDLYELCKENRMSKVVTAIVHGEYWEDGYLPVPYVVFEKAQDSLKNIRILKDPDIAWKLRSLHACFVGLSQLHNKYIAHQDIKPSNFLVFGHEFAKISDLGNATQKGNESPGWHHDGPCGDVSYAPVELLYSYCSSDWDTRRFGADLFMLGNIVVFMMTGRSLLVFLQEKVPSEFWWIQPGGKFFGGTFEQALPYIKSAYFESLTEISNCLPVDIRDELIEIITQLTDPEPERRGLPATLKTSLQQYSLQRYVSILNRIARKKELEFK